MELDCSICAGPIVDRAKPAECIHANFCFECLTQWFLLSNTCPLCKCNVKEVVHRPCKHCDFVRASDELELDEDEPAPDLSFAERRASARIRNKNLVGKPRNAPLGTGKIVSIGVHKVKKKRQQNAFGDDDPFWANSSDEEPTQCEVCHSGERDDVLLLCDMCDEAYHIYCLPVPLPAVPAHEWMCAKCDPNNEMNATFEGVSRGSRSGGRRRGTGRGAAANVTAASTSFSSNDAPSSPPSLSPTRYAGPSSSSSSRSTDVSSFAFPVSWPSSSSCRPTRSSSYSSPHRSSPSSSSFWVETEPSSQNVSVKEGSPDTSPPLGRTRRNLSDTATRSARGGGSRRNATAASRDIAAAAVAAITGRRPVPTFATKLRKDEEDRKPPPSLAHLPGHLQAAFKEDQRVASVVRVFPSRESTLRDKPYYNLSGLSDEPEEKGPAAEEWLTNLLRAPVNKPTLPSEVQPETAEEGRARKREQVRAAIQEANLARMFDRLRRTMRKKRDEEEAKIESLDKDSLSKIQTSTAASQIITNLESEKMAREPKPIAPFDETMLDTIKVERNNERMRKKKPKEVIKLGKHLRENGVEKRIKTEHKNGQSHAHRSHKPSAADRPFIQDHISKILSKRYPKLADPGPVHERVLSKVWHEWTAKSRPVSIASWLAIEKIRKWVADSISKQVKKYLGKSDS